MASAPTTRNILIALPLSLALSFISAIVYAFYPVIAVPFESSWGRGGSGGIGLWPTGWLSHSYGWPSCCGRLSS
jgi:hypothetical protein